MSKIQAVKFNVCVCVCVKVLKFLLVCKPSSFNIFIYSTFLLLFILYPVFLSQNNIFCNVETYKKYIYTYSIHAMNANLKYYPEELHFAKYL